MTTPEPFLVDPGWVRAVFVPHTGGPSYRVLFYEDGTARFEHRCQREPDFSVICAPALIQQEGANRILSHEPLTVDHSIRCRDCDTHGFIQEGRWVDA